MASYDNTEAVIWFKNLRDPSWMDEPRFKEWVGVIHIAAKVLDPTSVVVSKLVQYGNSWNDNVQYGNSWERGGVSAILLQASNSNFALVPTVEHLQYYRVRENNWKDITLLRENKPGLLVFPGEDLGTVAGRYDPRKKEIVGDGDIILSLVQALAAV